MNIEIVYHMYCVEDCVDRFLLSYDKISNSSLLEKCNKLHVVMVGNECKKYINDIYKLKKVEPHIRSNLFGEMNTIKFMQDLCHADSNIKLLYTHSKGASKGTNPQVRAWVEYMEYFLIEKHEMCLDLLAEYDTVGVDYLPGPMKHYSGNFWWANGSYIKNHKTFEEGMKTSAVSDPRWYCEFWLLDDNRVNYKCLHYSNADLYGTVYTKDKYIIS